MFHLRHVLVRASLFLLFLAVTSYLVYGFLLSRVDSNRPLHSAVHVHRSAEFPSCDSPDACRGVGNQPPPPLPPLPPLPPDPFTPSVNSLIAGDSARPACTGEVGNGRSDAFSCGIEQLPVVETAVCSPLRFSSVAPWLWIPRTPKPCSPLRPCDIVAIATVYNNYATLPQWIAAALIAGVDHIVLRDLRAKSNRAELVVTPWLEAGFLTLKRTSSPPAPHDLPSSEVRAQALFQLFIAFRAAARWVIVTSVDDYFPLPLRGLVAAADAEKLDTFNIPTKRFGPSNRRTVPYGQLVVEGFLHRDRSDSNATLSADGSSRMRGIRAFQRPFVTAVTSPCLREILADGSVHLRPHASTSLATLRHVSFYSPQWHRNPCFSSRQSQGSPPSPSSTSASDTCASPGDSHDDTLSARAADALTTAAATVAKAALLPFTPADHVLYVDGNFRSTSELDSYDFVVSLASNSSVRQLLASVPFYANRYALLTLEEEASRHFTLPRVIETQWEKDLLQFQHEEDHIAAMLFPPFVVPVLEDWLRRVPTDIVPRNISLLLWRPLVNRENAEPNEVQTVEPPSASTLRHRDLHYRIAAKCTAWRLDHDASSLARTELVPPADGEYRRRAYVEMT